MSDNKGSFPVRIDFDRILETIASRIYENQYAFLRENVQNAIDAIRIQAQREHRAPGDAAYRIDVSVDERTCSIADNGIGMTRDELINNFWTMGASGKNTPEARAAGCIGTFGIGGFANFGVCETLTVTSRTDTCISAHRTSLSREAFSGKRFELPEVSYSESHELASRGTIVQGVTKVPLDSGGLKNYVRQFVRHVGEAIYFEAEKISQEPFDSPPASRRPIGGSVGFEGLTFQLYTDSDSNLSAQVAEFKVPNGPTVECKGYVRLLGGALDVYKRGFRLCSTTVSSRIGVTGWLDCDLLRPTAGRDTLDSESLALLTRIFGIIEKSASELILRDTQLLAAHVRLIPAFLQQGRLEDLGELAVDIVGGQTRTLKSIRAAVGDERKVYYTIAGQGNATTEVLNARGHIVVRVSGNSQRRGAEIAYLRTFCQGRELDGLIECLEVYRDLDTFERSVLSELSLSIRNIFRPPDFQLVPGKLTLDTPIYWSGVEERGAVVVYVDTRHGEFQKLKPLGYSGLFWSMIEAFCREYLGDTLKRESTKFFGAGAIDLDAYSKAHAELWELVVGDIEVSRVGVSEGGRGGVGRVEVVGRNDIGHVTISNSGSTVVAAANEPRKAPKLLQIVDETGSVGVGGFYLRIPETATAAFGNIIRSFPSFAVVWFANRITWQGTDLNSTAFLFDIALDRLLAHGAGEQLGHGALELPASRLQTYQEQLYFYIPPALQARVVPTEEFDSVKIEIRHELVDLNRARSWTSKEPKAAVPV